MRITFALVFIIVCFSPLIAQKRTISGRLTTNDRNHSPIVGAIISIKGKKVYTVTNASGNYQIEVNVGDTLVFSAYGMQTKEIVVTTTNLKAKDYVYYVYTYNLHPQEKEQLLKIHESLYQDSISIKENAIITLSDTSSTYIISEGYRYKHGYSNSIPVKSIRKIKKGTYWVNTDNYFEPSLKFSTSWGMEPINKLPHLQNQYAQGRPVNGQTQWIGAEQQEIFSWGPLLSSLEFQETPYAFDKNGRLVPIGAGNGKTVSPYQNLSFFRTGYFNQNELNVTFPINYYKNKKGFNADNINKIGLDIENVNKTGIIPGSNYQKINVASKLIYNLSDRLSLNNTTIYNHSQGNLLSRGANFSSIVGSVYRTPASFDNSNGLSAKSAFSSNESYQLPDGSIRSHAPGFTDNPYGLVNTFPDRETLERIVSGIKMNYKFNTESPKNYNEEDDNLELKTNLDYQKNNAIFGIPPAYAGFVPGRLSERNDEQLLLNLTFSTLYYLKLKNTYSNLNINFTYYTSYLSRDLQRKDGFGFSDIQDFKSLISADSLNTINKKLSRTSHEVALGTRYFYKIYSDNIIDVKLNSKLYFSNTVDYGRFINFFPGISLSADINKMFNFYSPKLLIHADASRTIREAPLIYSNWAYGSTRLPVEAYNSFYEDTEIFFVNKLAPETEWKFQTGLTFNPYYFSNFNLNLNYFNNQTYNFIAPVFNGSGFTINNIGVVSNRGVTITFNYVERFYIYNSRIAFRNRLTWTKYNTMVQDLYGPEPFIDLAGFETIKSVLAEGEPLGAIYGTTYLRNAQGQIVIGPDGFPLENPTLSKIGNPIPDWLLGWSPQIEWKNLKLSFVFEFKKGGDLWNGTNSVLDYLGRSGTTGQQRNITNYVFEGVNANGAPNTIPVNFADPARPLSENRWVRYGWDGIGEAYIEDASWIRCTESTLSYELELEEKWIKQMTFAFITHNLFLITPYTGVDPASSSLFGYPTSNGLDLFNLPSTRSFALKVSFKL